MNEQEREDCGEDAPEFARIVRIAEAACAEAGGVKLAATPAPAPEAESLQEQLDEALSSLDFYKRRSAALQACQHMMRDPERTMVCDILANGSLLINGKGELAPERYAPAQAQQAAEPLPCPFCGHVGLDFADGSTHRWGLASCAGCGATCGETRRAYPPDDKWHASAIKDWNTRAKPEAQQPLGEAQLEAAYREIWRNKPAHFGFTTSDWITAGIRYAERAHGIGASGEASNGL